MHGGSILVKELEYTRAINTDTLFPSLGDITPVEAKSFLSGAFLLDREVFLELLNIKSFQQHPKELEFSDNDQNAIKLKKNDWHSLLIL